MSNARITILAVLIVTSGLSCQGGKTQPGRSDPHRLMGHVASLVKGGLREPGSPAAGRARAYITKSMKAYGLKVTQENFLASTPRGPLVMVNVVGQLQGSGSKRVVLGTHVDTKTGLPQGFQGANDGASGCAVLLELARLSALETWPFSIEFVFFDGEEAFLSFSPQDGLYGSKEYVRRHTLAGDLNNIRAVFVVDMVGDKTLKLVKDTHSHKGLYGLLRRAGKEAGLNGIFLEDPISLLDDHIPFKEAGIPAAVLIDFEYGPKNKFWHTEKDTLDKISRTSLVRTTRLVMRTLEILAEDGFPP